MNDATVAATSANLTAWIDRYRAEQKAALDSIPTDAVARLVGRLRAALAEDRRSSSSATAAAPPRLALATDLGKGASDKLASAFRVLSLNDNASWMTALGNDYATTTSSRASCRTTAGRATSCCDERERQLAQRVKAIEWAKDHGLFTAALLGNKRGRLAEIADEAIVIDSPHYGRVEDAHMGICHMLCYAFIEGAAKA
jgi:D-sedoheptulose 7-phosphate isomerase